MQAVTGGSGAVAPGHAWHIPERASGTKSAAG